GDVLSVTTEALPGQEFRGQISGIAPSADTKSRVFDVEVTIPNPAQALKVGMIASLLVADGVAPEQLSVVSLDAIVRSKERPDGYSVFVVEESGDLATVRAREVSLGSVTGGDVVVTSGLAVGDRIVVTGATLVVDGDRVRVVP